MKTLLNTVMQIDETENRSEERFIISYDDDSVTKKTILNVADLNESDLAIYTNFKTLLSTKMNEIV